MLKLCLLNAALDTDNLGVSALSHALIHGLNERVNFKLTLFDYGKGLRNRKVETGGGSINIECCGAYPSWRIYRPESLRRIWIEGHRSRSRNPALKAMRNASVALDISGGDSFTDIYGHKRFSMQIFRKRIVIDQGLPLVLLPQTYGPFLSSNSSRQAKQILRQSAMTWARDDHSFEVLRELLGSAFDPSRHRVGVDVAFGLPTSPPAEEVIATKQDWFEDKRSPLVGLNVSGLLMNRPKEAAEQYGLKAEYGEVILAFIRRLLKESDARVLLIAHVVAPQGHYESDIEACEVIAEALEAESCDRVALAPVVHDPCEVKWIIAQCDWFCGTRMHSTIAALSSGVPTAAISYSPKTLGVFETCGQGARVADPRQLDTEEVVEQLWRSWLERESARQSLSAALPGVLQQAKSQMDEIVATSVSFPSSRLSRTR